MTPERETIIKRITNEGRDACRKGKPFFENPYSGMNFTHWSYGYLQEQKLTDAGCKE